MYMERFQHNGSALDDLISGYLKEHTKTSTDVVPLHPRRRVGFLRWRWAASLSHQEHLLSLTGQEIGPEVLDV